MKYYIARIADNFGGLPVYAIISEREKRFEAFKSGTTPSGLAEIVVRDESRITIDRNFFKPPKGTVLFYGGTGTIKKLSEREINEFQISMAEILGRGCKDLK